MSKPTKGMEAIIQELKSEVVECEFMGENDDQSVYKVEFSQADPQAIREYLSRFERRVNERFGYPQEKISVEKRRPQLSNCESNERYVVLNSK